jgi:hypothetical protein
MERKVIQKVKGFRATDGAGVSLVRCAWQEGRHRCYCQGHRPRDSCQSPEKDAAKGSGSGRAGLHGPERQHALYRENGLP